MVSIPGIVSPALAHSHRTGAIETGQHMSVSVPLRLHNTADLDAFPAQVSDPMSAQYGHYLTPAQFTERFGPTAAEVTRVSGFLSSAGLHVDSVSGDRQVVVASGTVDQLQKAFNTTLSR
ncbi:MAG: hypothetical protein JO285_04080 [Kutzneria sp.]|nr:hypothetical protein [Kutzneria sp.]